MCGACTPRRPALLAVEKAPHHWGPQAMLAMMLPSHDQHSQLTQMQVHLGCQYAISEPGQMPKQLYEDTKDGSCICLIYQTAYWLARTHCALCIADAPLWHVSVSMTCSWSLNGLSLDSHWTAAQQPPTL